jgi:hypothetical protein
MRDLALPIIVALIGLILVVVLGLDLVGFM